VDFGAGFAAGGLGAPDALVTAGEAFTAGAGAGLVGLTSAISTSYYSKDE
jgi:hypothetical protein